MMSGQLFLLILALFFSIIQTDSFIDGIKMINIYKDNYATQLVNRQLNLIAWCDKSRKCNRAKFPDGYIEKNVFLPDIFNNIATQDVIVSCYKEKYIYTFFSDNKILRQIRTKQISALLEKKTQGRTFYVNRDAKFYDEIIPAVLCSYNGKKFEKKNIDFFLINYNG